MRYGDKGSDVVEVQRILLARGYALPRYGADGVLGAETWAALEAYARDARLQWNPEVPSAVVEDLVVPSSIVIDLTAKQTNPPSDPSKWRIGKDGKVVVRDPRTITGIMLHQTGVWFSVSSQQVAAALGDRHAALHNRGLNIACHAVAWDGKGANLQCGHAVATAPLDWYCYQANGANADSVGLEVEGVYPGLESPGCVMPSQRVIDAARAAVKYLVEAGRAQGMPIEFIWAHRQSSANRRGDPGESLWREVALNYAVAELGLRTSPNTTWGDGRPIPVEWQLNGVGKY